MCHCCMKHQSLFIHNLLLVSTLGISMARFLLTLCSCSSCMIQTQMKPKPSIFTAAYKTQWRMQSCMNLKVRPQNEWTSLFYSSTLKRFQPPEHLTVLAGRQNESKRREGEQTGRNSSLPTLFVILSCNGPNPPSVKTTAIQCKACCSVLFD
jgi:hypothetical protein